MVLNPICFLFFLNTRWLLSTFIRVAIKNGTKRLYDCNSVSDEGGRSHGKLKKRKKRLIRLPKKTLKIYIAYLLLLTMIGPVGGRVHKITLTKGHPEYSGQQKGNAAYKEGGESLNWRYNWW